MKRSIDDPHGYLERLRPIYIKLFRVAHAVIGNLELSEYVLKSAIVEAYLRRNEWRDRMGFQEGLTHTVRAVALVELKGVRAAGAYEQDWTLPVPAAPEEPESRALLSRLIRESEATKRVVLLHYGCDLTHQQIGQVMGIRPAEVKGRLRRLCSRLRRSVGLSGRRAQGALEDRLERLCEAALSLPGEDVAEMGAVFRSFERDTEGAKRPRASAGRVLGWVIKGVAALLLAVAFWLAAVLLEPSTSVGPAPGDARLPSAIETAAP